MLYAFVLSFVFQLGRWYYLVIFHSKFFHFLTLFSLTLRFNSTLSIRPTVFSQFYFQLYFRSYLVPTSHLLFISSTHHSTLSYFFLFLSHIDWLIKLISVDTSFHIYFSSLSLYFPFNSPFISFFLKFVSYFSRFSFMFLFQLYVYSNKTLIV